MNRDLTIAAYVDGELSPGSAAEFEEQMRQDAALAAEVDRVAAVRARLAQTYAPALDEPVPPRLAALASAANDPGTTRSRLWQGAGLAAVLVIGVLIGHTAWPVGGPVSNQEGALVARGELARALDTQLAADAGPTRVGLTFRGPGQAWCRTFSGGVRDASGVACRRNERWVIEALAPAPRAHDGSVYRTAGSAISPALVVVVEQLRVGDPVGAQQERAARDRRWR